jgi:hypothetical protein
MEIVALNQLITAEQIVGMPPLGSAVTPKRQASAGAPLHLYKNIVNNQIFI